MGQKPAQSAEARGHGTVGLHTDIAAEKTQIHLHVLNLPGKSLGQARQAVQVEIGEQQYAEPVKRLGQIREIKSVFYYPYIPGILQSFFLETGQFEKPGVEHFIRQETTQVEQGLPAGQRCMAGPPLAQTSR